MASRVAGRAGIEPTEAWFRATLACQQTTAQWEGGRFGPCVSIRLALIRGCRPSLRSRSARGTRMALCL